jgi:hypothetical protein
MSRTYRCLVITADGVPVEKISAERAVVHLMQGKAYMLLAQEGVNFRSMRETWPVPAVIAMLKYYKLPGHYYGAANLSGNSLLRRDSWTCQYCRRQKHELADDEFLTRDHVFPLSRGGEDIWENVVTACISCNNKKGDRTPEEAGMPLIYPPYAPTRRELYQQFHSIIDRVADGHLSSEEIVETDDAPDDFAGHFV